MSREQRIYSKQSIGESFAIIIKFNIYKLMGNIELKAAFKNALKGDLSGAQPGGTNKLGLTAEILLEDSLVSSVDQYIKSKMQVAEVDQNKAFPDAEGNIQTVENSDEMYKRQLIAELNENYIAGFSTAESNIEFLKEPSFEKFFTVNSPDSIKEYSKLQQQKFVILYALYVEKYREQQDKKTNFFDYIQNFLDDSGEHGDKSVSPRIQVGLESGFKFSLSLLKEIRNINKDMLVNSLEYLYQTLRYAQPGSLFSTDKLSFMIDSNLNDARSFLVQLIEERLSNVSGNKRATELAFKILLLLGIVRSNVEDLLMVATLLDRLKEEQVVDLRVELEILLQDSIQNINDNSGPTKIPKFDNIKVGKNGIIFFLKAGKFQQEIKQRAALTCDGEGQLVYIHQEGLGLVKMGTGAQGQMIGQVFQHLPDYRKDEHLQILKLHNHIYVRSESLKPKPFVRLNASTLEEDSKEEFELEKQDKNVEWKENQDNGRSLTYTPLISDGQYIYVISQLKEPKSKEPENPDEKKPEEKPPMLVVEIYDPKTNEFKFIRDVCLYKNKEHDAFVKEKNSIDFLKDSSFATNGQVLMIHTTKKVYFFDLKSGEQVQKDSISEFGGVDHTNCRIAYDFYSNQFYSFKYNESDTKMEAFTISNFKKGEVSSGFDKDFLSKRFTIFKNSVYGDNKDASLLAKKNPFKLNLIQRIMKNVTTPVLINHANKESQMAVMPNEKQMLNKYQKALILGHIYKQCQNFEVRMDEVMSQKMSPSEQEKQMIQFFKFPNATYLTNVVFQQIQENLDRTSYLINSRKTSDTLADSYCFFLTLKILTANFKALTFCSISLPDLMEEEDTYELFLKAYRHCIVNIIEQGYSQDFEEGDSHEELTKLWGEISKMCLDIMSSSINLIYSDINHVLSNLDENLKNLKDEKQAENSCISLNYLGQTENTKKLLLGSSDDLKVVTRVYEQCSHLKSQNVIASIKQTPLSASTLTIVSSNLSNASIKFLKNLSEQSIVYYCALLEAQAVKSQAPSGLNAEREEKEKQRINDLEQLIMKFFEVASHEIINQLNTMRTSLTSELDSKAAPKAEGDESDPWDQINEKYERFSGFMDQIFQFNSGFVQIVNLYIQTFGVFKLKTSLLPTICHSSSDIIREISLFNTLMKKHKEKVSSFEGEKDRLKIFLDSFSRSLSWFVGQTAFKLIKVTKKEEEKKEEGADEEKKNNKEEQEKMHDMIIQSNLLSGGIENRNIHIFSAESIAQIEDLIKISQDKKLLTMVKDSKISSDDDILIAAIINPGLNQMVDRIVGYLQNIIEAKRPLIPHARLGGADGLRMTRAAFGVMVKFSDITDTVQTLVDEIDLIWMDLESDSERDLKIKEALKALPNFENLLKRWESASKMRIWINEKKLNLADRLLKQTEVEFRKKKEEAKKKAEEEKTAKDSDDKKDDEEKVKSPEDEKPAEEKVEAKKEEANGASEDQAAVLEVDDIEIIDTSSKPKGKEEEEKKEEPVAESNENELSPAEKAEIQELSDKKFETELASIFGKIVEKADLMVKLQVPAAYLYKDPSKRKEGTLLMIREPSKNKDEDPKQEINWKDRLKSWRQMQTSKGAIKSFTEKNKEIFDSSLTSILSCLQTAISAQKIKKQVETVFLNGCKRVAGLKLLGELLNYDLPQNHTYDLMSWFCGSLRGNKNPHVSHYLDDLKGCGLHLEELAKVEFFGIMKGMVQKLKESKDVEEIKVIINCLKWKYLARDHQSLFLLEIFKILHQGNGKDDNLMKKAWGRAIKQEVVTQEKDKKITREVMELFEQVFLLTAGRIIKPDTGAHMKLKQKGTAVPTLEKAQSRIDENVSELLIGQAFEVMFREFERYVKIMKSYKGVDWSVFVKTRNKERKNNESKKEYEDEKLFDEDDSDKKEEEEPKKEEDGGSKKEDQKEEVKNEEDPPVNETTETKNSEVVQDNKPESNIKQVDKKPEDEENKDKDEKNDENDDDIEEDEDKKEDDDEEVEEKEKEFAIKKQDERAEKEMKSIFKLYSESFLRRLLRLVEMFTSIATVSPYPLSMVQKVANPHQLETLLNVLILSSPRIKIIVLKIIQNLIKIAIPFEVFEETITIISKDPKSHAHNILTKVSPSVNLDDQKFLKFLYNYLLSIRHKMWTKSSVESEGQYAVTQEIAQCLRIILQDEDKHERQRRLLNAQIKDQLLKVETMSIQEIDIIFSIVCGADFLGLQAGQHALTKNNQRITIVGFSSTWDDDAQLSQASSEVLQKLNLTINQHSLKDKVVGLFFDPTARQRQELIRVDAKDVTPIIDIDNAQEQKDAKFSLLNDPEIVQKFVYFLNDSSVEGQTSANKLLINQLSLHILKSLSHMINSGEGQFLTMLKEQGLLETFVKHLYHRQSSSQNKVSKDLIPVEWLELKCTEIKKKALENDYSLINTVEDMSAQILNKKQIVINSTDPASGESFIQNAQLLSAINLHDVPEAKNYKVMLSKDLTNFITDQAPQPNSILNKKYGVVFFDAQDLSKLDSRALNVLLSSQIVITTNEAKPQEIYTKLVKLSKEDDEKEEKLRTLSGLLESVIIFIRKQDYERLQKPIQLTIKPLFKEAKSPFFGLIDELSAYGGIDRHFLLYHFSDLKDEPFNVIATKITKLLKDTEAEAQKNKDRLKKLEVDKKPKELEALKKKLSEIEAKKQQEMQEKLLKIKEIEDPVGGSMAKKESLIEKVVRENITEASNRDLGEVVPLLDLLKGDDKRKENIEKIITDKVGAFSEDNLNDEAKNKSDEALNKEFYKQITNFDEQSLPSEYDSTLSQLTQMYGRRTLVNILNHKDLLPILLPSLLKEQKDQQTFVCFLKSSYNEALVMKISSGQKKQIKTIKLIIKNVLTYCIQEGNNELKQFVGDLVVQELLHKTLKTVNNFYSTSCKSISEYFKSEDKVINDMNPYLFVFLINFFLDSAPHYLLGDNVPSVATLIPNLFNIALYTIIIFQADPTTIKTRLYEIIVRLVNFCGKKLKDSVRLGIMQHLLNNEIFKKMVQAVDYDDSTAKYNNQMKILLEVHLKLSDLHSQIIEQQIAQIDSNLENSEGILAVKRGKQILQEKQKFDFLKYFIHYEGLEDHHKELLNQTIEQNHYAFDSKIIARYSMKQTEMLKLKFKEDMKVKDFCFIAIGLNPKIESEMELYSNDDIHGSEKEVTLFKGDFYVIYPVRKQMVIAFGEGANNRLGVNSTSNTGPKACYMTKNLNSKRVVTGYAQTVIIDEEDRLFKCGQIEKTSESLVEYTHVSAITEKIKHVTCGKYNITVVTDKNSVYRQGYSKDGHLGLNTEYNSFTKLEKVDDEEQFKEPIVDLSSGEHFTLFVTESGKLYGTGNKFLKEISLDCDSKVIQIPIKDGVKVLRVYSSNGHKQPLAFIKVRLESGEEQLWSAGRSEQGLLGQGQGIKSSKIFKPVKYDSQAIQFVEISMHSEHVITMDQKGQLYGWGSNLQKRAGFKEDIYDGIFEPKRITFHEPENLIPIKFSCGFDHTLILFEEQGAKQRKLYSVGTNETNYHHLGTTQIEAADTNIFFREITAFQDFNIVDFSAGHRSSHVIIQGDKDLHTGLQHHTIGEGLEKREAKGILHFYRDNNGIMQYLTEEDYQAKKDSLPDICLATKYPINHLESNTHIPALIKLAGEFIDQSETVHKDISCDVTKKPIEAGVRYFSFSKINGDEQKLNMSESGFQQPSIYDINPLVYYRLAKPLKEGARLPLLDSKDIFKETADHGIDMEVVPTVEFQKNDKLIEVTKQIYDEITENINKFAPELDTELLYEVNRYIGKSLSDKEVQEIVVKDDFKLSEMTFRAPKLKKLSEAIKRRRIELYINFNKFFIKLMPYIATNSRKKAGGDITKQFMEVKSMILLSMKNKFLKDVINSLPRGSQQTTHIKRIKAKTFIESGEVDHTGEYTLFGQLFTQIKKAKNFDCFRMNSTDDRCWRANFVGEGSIDAGGPFRDSLSNICEELESDTLPLLVKTSNNRNNHGENRDCYLPNGSSNNPTHHELFKFLGNVLGFAIRTQSPLNLHFPPLFWKQLLSETPTYEDLKGIDQYTFQTLEGLRKQAKELTDEMFDELIEERFVRVKNSGEEIELKKGGKNIKVTRQNLDEYIELNKQARFNEYQDQMKSIIEGVDHVLPLDNLKLFTWNEIESRACGDKMIDLEKFKKMTQYGGCDENHPNIQMFWRMFEQFTDEERTLYLKFVWGRSRLPAETKGLRDTHTIDFEDYMGDNHLPVSHTCFFSVELPKYTTDEICKKKFTIAITMCGDIDGDGGANYDPDDPNGGDDEY